MVAFNSVALRICYGYLSSIVIPHLHIKTPGKVDQQIPRAVGNNPDNDGEIRASDTATQFLFLSQDLPRQQIPEQFEQGDSVRVQDPHTKLWDVTALVTGFSPLDPGSTPGPGAKVSIS